MTDSNVELAQRGYEAMTGGDVETVRELLDPAAHAVTTTR